ADFGVKQASAGKRLYDAPHRHRCRCARSFPGCAHIPRKDRSILHASTPMVFAIPSLLAAMTIAGAFWVGVLAARRLRDWGDNSRALEQGEAPLALAAASGAPSDSDAVKKVRARVAERLEASL